MLTYLSSYRQDIVDPRGWDAQWQAGRWDYLAGVEERPRNSVVGAYCDQRDGNVDVLDLGCGAGLLARELLPAKCRTYLGVDLSATAIARARANVPDGAEFIVGDIESYVPSRRFDVIVLNEVLYYLKSPEALLQRSSALLTDEGLIVVSLWEDLQSWQVWRRCASEVAVLHEVLLRSKQTAWRVRLCRPLGRSTAFVADRCPSAEHSSTCSAER